MRMEAKQFGADQLGANSVGRQAAAASEAQQTQQRRQQSNQAEMFAADLRTMRDNDNDHSFVQQGEREQCGQQQHQQIQRNEHDELGEEHRRRLSEWSLMQIVESAESKLMRQKAQQQQRRQQSLRTKPSKLLLKSPAFATNTLGELELNKLASSNTAAAAATTTTTQSDGCYSTYTGDESGPSGGGRPRAEGSAGSPREPIGPAQMGSIQSGQWLSKPQQQRQSRADAASTSSGAKMPECSRKSAGGSLVSAAGNCREQRERPASMTNRRSCLNGAPESAGGKQPRQDYISAGNEPEQAALNGTEEEEEAHLALRAGGQSRAPGPVDLNAGAGIRASGGQQHQAAAASEQGDGAELGQDERGGPTPTNDLIRALIHKDRLALKSDLAPLAVAGQHKEGQAAAATEPPATTGDAVGAIRSRQPPSKQVLSARRNKTDGFATTPSNLTVRTATATTSSAAGDSPTLNDDSCFTRRGGSFCCGRQDRLQERQPNSSCSGNSGGARTATVATIATRLKLSPASCSLSPPSSAGSSGSASSSPSATSSSASSCAAFSAALSAATATHDNTPDKCSRGHQSRPRQPAMATTAPTKTPPQTITSEQLQSTTPQRKRSMFDLSGLISKCQHLQVSPEASSGADSAGELVAAAAVGVAGEQCGLSPYRRAAQALAKSISSRKPSDPTAMVSSSRAAELPAVVGLQQQRRHSTYLLPTLLINKGPSYLSDDSSSPSEDDEANEANEAADADVELEEIERLALADDDSDCAGSDNNNESAREFKRVEMGDDQTEPGHPNRLIGLPKLLAQNSPRSLAKTRGTSATCRKDNSRGAHTDARPLMEAASPSTPGRRVTSDSGCVGRADGAGHDEATTMGGAGAKLTNSASSPSALSTPTNESGGCGGPCCSQQAQLVRLAAENAGLTRRQLLSLREPAGPLPKKGTSPAAARKLSLFSLSSAATALVAATAAGPQCVASQATSSVATGARNASKTGDLAASCSHQLQAPADQHQHQQLQSARQQRLGSNPLDRLRLTGGELVASRKQPQPSAADCKRQLAASSNSGRLGPASEHQLAAGALSVSACAAALQPAKPQSKRHSLVNMFSSGGQQHFASSHHLVSRLAHPRSLFPGGQQQHWCANQKCPCESHQDCGRRRKNRASLEGASISVGLPGSSGGCGTERFQQYEPLIPERGFKIVVMGTSGSGKTSIIQRFMYDSFDSRHLPTVEDTYFIEFPYMKNTINISISDTSGTYQFPAMRKLAINSGDAFILVYSVDDPKSFDDLEELRQTILEERERAYLEASASLTSNESNSSGLTNSIGSSQSSCASNNSASHQQLQQSFHQHHHHHHHQHQQQQLGQQQPTHNYHHYHGQQQQLLFQPADPNNHRDLSPSRHWSLASLFSHQASQGVGAGGGQQQQQQHGTTSFSTATNSLASSICSSSCSSTDNSRRSSISAAEAALKTRRTRRPPMVIVANKYDLPEDKHLVNSDEIEALVVIDWNNGFVRASAAQSLNINEIFQQVLRQAKQPPTLTEAIVSKRRKSLPPKLPHPT